MKNFLPLALLLLLMGLGSCNRTPKSIDPVSPAATKAQLDVLRDSVNSRWSQMMASDDAKINATNQVLHSLSQQAGSDKTQLQQLEKANNRLRRVRYTQQSIVVSAKIDAYDAAQDSVLHALYPLALPAAGQPDATIQQLTTAIQNADNELVGYRLRYDQAAKQLNNYLKLHQLEIAALGKKYRQLQPLPLFELQQ